MFLVYPALFSGRQVQWAGFSSGKYSPRISYFVAIVCERMTNDGRSKSARAVISASFFVEFRPRPGFFVIQPQIALFRRYVGKCDLNLSYWNVAFPNFHRSPH